MTAPMTSREAPESTENILWLAEAIHDAREAWANSIGSPDEIILQRALEQTFWNDKGGFAPMLRELAWRRTAGPAQAPTPAQTDEPVCWIVPAKEIDNVRIWWRRKEMAEEWAKTHNAPLIPLYAHPRCADAVLSLGSSVPSTLPSPPPVRSSHNSGEADPSVMPDSGGGDPARCEICNWPLAESAEKGCIPGDCSYRPDDPAEQQRIRERRQLVASKKGNTP